MDNLSLVQCCEARYHLIENLPNLRLFHVRIGLLECVNFSLEITTIAILHNNTQCQCFFIVECLFVACDVFVLHAGENAHFIDCIVLFFLTEFRQFDLLKCMKCGSFGTFLRAYSFPSDLRLTLKTSEKAPDPTL